MIWDVENMAELWIDTRMVCDNYHHYGQQGMVIPVVKKDGYGLGAEVMLPLLMGQGATLFACARPEEALGLSGKGADILLLSCEYDRQVLRNLAEQNVILSVESLQQAKRIHSLGMPVRVHLAVDTGFGRFGFACDETAKMKAVFYLDRLQVCGIFSHFRSKKSAPGQFERFSGVLKELEDYPVGLRHLAATSCAGELPFQLDAVRIGSGLVKNAARLTARICTVRHLGRGSRVGYGSTRLLRDTDVAIVDAGTGDGAFVHRGCGLRTWLADRRRSVEINGLQAPVLGVPGLTHTAVDVTGISCAIGDTVTIPQTPVLVSPSVPRRYMACYRVADCEARAGMRR